MLDLREERMSRTMVKWHIGGMPHAAVLHQFTGPDHGFPHNHPWGFESIVLSGGYSEQVFQLDGSSELIHHWAGDSFHIAASHIHRIVDIPTGECWTLILPGPWEQEPGFYDFRPDGAYYRPWHRQEFERI